MAQQTDAELLAAAEIIKDETQSKANTHTRVGVMLENLIESKLNNESVGPLIAATTGKTTPVDGDSTILSDSEASGAQKKLTWANLKATLKTYFDSLYQAALGYTAENTSNKSNSYTLTSTTTYPNTKALVDGLAAERTYAEGLVVGLWDDRGNFDASVNAYPSSGGSGTAGAIMKGDIWTISVTGTLPTGLVVEVGDTVRALIDSPGNTQANWAIAQNNLGYVAENQANKTDTITGNEASSTLFASIKGIVDWTIANVFNPKISADAYNDITTGTDSGAFYEEAEWLKQEVSGYSCTPTDPIIIGSFNANPLPAGVIPESIQIYVSRNLQMESQGDYSNVGGALQWNIVLAGVGVVVYWRQKFA